VPQPAGVTSDAHPSYGSVIRARVERRLIHHPNAEGYSSRSSTLATSWRTRVTGQCARREVLEAASRRPSPRPQASRPQVSGPSARPLVEAGLPDVTTERTEIKKSLARAEMFAADEPWSNPEFGLPWPEARRPDSAGEPGIPEATSDGPPGEASWPVDSRPILPAQAGPARPHSPNGFWPAPAAEPMSAMDLADFGAAMKQVLDDAARRHGIEV
jgi:hypothetical protein